MKTLRQVLTVLAALSLVPSQASAESPGAAAQVVQLRREVDALAQELADRRRAVRGELAALRAERAELKRQVRLAKVRAQALDQLESRRTARAKSDEEQSKASLPPARQAVAAARAYVMAALPFKTKERLKTLDLIEGELTASRPDVGRALTRLWRFLEEEQALAGEVALAQQPIELDGQRLLVDVVRVGMALLYARTPDGRFAWAVAAGEGWEFAALTDAASTELVRSLFTTVEANQTYGPGRLLIPSGLGDRPGSGA